MVTLTGTFTRLDGSPATGTVRVTPSRSPIMDPDGKIVISGPQTFPLDKDGKLSTEIPASNDPDLGPPFTYAIDVNLTHANWKISKVWIPHGSTTVDLSEIGDYTPTPGVATRVVTIPADGTDGQVLVWDGAGFSWDFPPEGPQGPKGDLDAEQLAGAPRLTNIVHDTSWSTSDATIESQTDRTVEFTATARRGYIRNGPSLAGGVSYYVSAEVKTTSDQVGFGASTDPVYHSGSGDWERLTGRVTPSGVAYFVVRDNRQSGWDQIEVRDPVLIDLTAVFGAGREPTREYMDELLAKHDHYIGGIDQFAFGDALRALTVAGPGLTLRHDTTVGTRVLLDHPGGTTTLYGDTGWRNISGLLENGATGQLRAHIHTRGAQPWVTISANYVTDRLDTTNATSDTILNLSAAQLAPANYLGTYTTLGTFWTQASGSGSQATAGVSLVSSERWLRVSARDLLHGVISYPIVAWPTVLPGTPV